MNDTIDTDNNTSGGLKGSFGDRGINMNAMGYGHPHGDKIIGEARQILLESETGRTLIKILDHHRIPIIIMKGNGDGGFSPEMKTITIQVPGKIKKATGEFVISFIKAIREADQEFAGSTAPDAKKDIIAFAGFIHARNIDSTWYACKTIKELTNSSFYSVLLDLLTNLGLNRLYKAFLEGVSKKELYDYYAEAYYNRGSN